MASEDYVDALTLNRLADAFGWDKATKDAVAAELSNYKDSVITKQITDNRASGVWAMPNVINN